MMKTYSMLDAMLASPSEPMPEAHRRYQLTRMWQGLAAMEMAEHPTREDWAVCSDAVNLMETLIVSGKVEDTDGLLLDAITALAGAGQRSFKGQKIRLDGPGIQAVRAILEDYAVVLDTLPARTMIHAHRLTEQRIQGILRGYKKSHDVIVSS